MYSQLGQDDWVLSVLPIHNGFFVDIGYRYPINISNTYLLELNGWSGIGSDPLLGHTYDDTALSIEDNWSIRPNTILYNYAIYSSSNLEIDIIKAGNYSGITDHSPLYQKKIKKNKTCEIFKATTKTLEDLLMEANAPQNIHYLSLDTEGSEYEILRVFPFDKWNFGCITVEHNKNIENKKNIRDLLELNGYEIIKDKRYDFFCTHQNIKQLFPIDNDSIENE